MLDSPTRNDNWRTATRLFLTAHAGETFTAGDLYERFGAAMPLCQATRCWLADHDSLGTTPHGVMRWRAFCQALRRLPVRFKPPLSRSSPLREDTLVTAEPAEPAPKRRQTHVERTNHAPVVTSPALVSRPMPVPSQPVPFWGVVRSNPQRERFASERVGALGYNVFLPMVATKQGGAPLWRGYFFAQITSAWRPISSCFGVLCLVRVGDCPQVPRRRDRAAQVNDGRRLRAIAGLAMRAQPACLQAQRGRENNWRALPGRSSFALGTERRGKRILAVEIVGRDAARRRAFVNGGYSAMTLVADRPTGVANPAKVARKESELLAVIAASPGLRRVEICAAVEEPAAATATRLNRLGDRGLIERVDHKWFVAGTTPVTDAPELPEF